MMEIIEKYWIHYTTARNGINMVSWIHSVVLAMALTSWISVISPLLVLVPMIILTAYLRVSKFNHGFNSVCADFLHFGYKEISLIAFQVSIGLSGWFIGVSANHVIVVFAIAMVATVIALDYVKRRYIAKQQAQVNDYINAVQTSITVAKIGWAIFEELSKKDK